MFKSFFGSLPELEALTDKFGAVNKVCLTLGPKSPLVSCNTMKSGDKSLRLFVIIGIIV